MENKMYSKILWLDLEFTNLVFEKAHILEAAAVVTDAQLGEIEALSMIINQPNEIIENMKKDKLQKTDAKKPELKDIKTVYDIHQKNGLIEEVRNSPFSQVQAEKKFVDLVKRNFTEERAVLAGNSIYYDKSIIRYCWPTLFNLLHYRSIDVSSFKLVLVNGGIDEYQKQSTHRALDDIRESIAELKYYLKFIKQN